jgi:hypothetical protein
VPIYETYSERKRRNERGDAPDVYDYEKIPEKLRHQIIHCWNDAFKSVSTNDRFMIYQAIEKTIAKAEGRPSLGPKHANPEESCQLWLLLGDTDEALSIIELAARFMIQFGPLGVVEELNFRFRQNGIGYQFENGQIVKIDDQFIHSEVVKPAIALLTSDPAYKTASEEFMLAHSHYRGGLNQDAVVAANRAFESTLKAVCQKRKWAFEKGARASDLVKLLRAKNLFPSHLDGAFDSYVAMMKSGLPGVRNEAGGHGPAPGDAKIPDYLAAYAIHLSAASIVVVIEAERKKH